MASTKRPSAKRNTSAAPRGRRVSITLSEEDYARLSYYTARFRLTPQELISGMLDWLPDQSPDKFFKILMQATLEDI